MWKNFIHFQICDLYYYILFGAKDNSKGNQSHNCFIVIFKLAAINQNHHHHFHWFFLLLHKLRSELSGSPLGTTLLSSREIFSRRFVVPKPIERQEKIWPACKRFLWCCSNFWRSLKRDADHLLSHSKTCRRISLSHSNRKTVIPGWRKSFGISLSRHIITRRWGTSASARCPLLASSILTFFPPVISPSPPTNVGWTQPCLNFTRI